MRRLTILDLRSYTPQHSGYDTEGNQPPSGPGKIACDLVPKLLLEQHGIDISQARLVLVGPEPRALHTAELIVPHGTTTRMLSALLPFHLAAPREIVHECSLSATEYGTSIEWNIVSNHGADWSFRHTRDLELPTILGEIAFLDFGDEPALVVLVSHCGQIESRYGHLTCLQQGSTTPTQEEWQHACPDRHPRPNEGFIYRGELLENGALSIDQVDAFVIPQELIDHAVAEAETDAEAAMA